MMLKKIKRGAAAMLSAAMMFTFIPMLDAGGTQVQAAGGRSFSNANTISLNSTDVDNNVYRADKYWKFTTSGRDSYYDIQVSNGREDNIYVYLYNNNKSALDDMSVYDYSTENMEMKLSKNTTHYIKVDPSDYSKRSGKVTVKIRELVDNAGDSYTTARSITGSHNGAIEIYGDNDWFKFTAPAAGKYRIKVANKSTDHYIDWDILNSNVSVIDDITTWSTSANYVDRKLAKGSVIYVRIGDDSWQNIAKYNLCITRIIPKPAKPVITKAVAEKKKATIKWKKANNATSYLVLYKRSGASKWNKKYVKGTKLTIHKLPSKKKCKFKIRSIRTEGNKKTYSAWSKTKTLKIK